MKRIRVGLSTCPNDIYAFAALLDGRIQSEGIECEFVLDDVEQLNQRLDAGELDASKASFALWFARAERFALLPVGSALGYGVGPLVLKARTLRVESARGLTLCPGRWTTATLLHRLLLEGERAPEQVRFSEILPRLEQGTAQFGVCIHEARFTWREHGVDFQADLGSRWEELTHLPLPLGGVLVRRDLAPRVQQALARAIASSLALADALPELALPSMRRWAQEQNDQALWAHVSTYVGPQTRGLDDLGRRALLELARRSAVLGLGARPEDLLVVRMDASPAALWQTLDSA